MLVKCLPIQTCQVANVSLPCYLVPSSRGRLLVIPMTVSLQASRSLVSVHSSVSVQFVMALMSSSHRARGLPLFLAPPPIPNIIDFSKLFSLRMMCPKYDSCCFFISVIRLNIYSFMRRIQCTNNIIVRSIVNSDLIFSSLLWRNWRQRLFYIPNS